MSILKFQTFSKHLKQGRVLLSAGPDGKTDDVPEMSVHYIERKAGEEVRPHTHGRTEVFLVHSGKAVMMVGDDIREVTSGDVALAPVGAVHAIWVPGPEALHYFAFNSPPSLNIPTVEASEEVVRQWKQALERIPSVKG
jgi:mannose-6-phosphate isomerase-like protein (cupin superfamily)